MKNWNLTWAGALILAVMISLYTPNVLAHGEDWGDEGWEDDGEYTEYVYPGSISVSYDGNPRFRRVEGMRLQYAMNANIPIIRVEEHRFFALNSGIWFQAVSAFGPWVTAAAVPAEIYEIPASCPVHSVTYVRVGSGSVRHVRAQPAQRLIVYDSRPAISLSVGFPIVVGRVAHRWPSRGWDHGHGRGHGRSGGHHRGRH